MVRLLSGQIPLALLRHCRAPSPGIFSPGARRAFRRQQPSGLSFAPPGTYCRAGSRERGRRIALGQMDHQALVCVFLEVEHSHPELVDFVMVLVSKTVAVINSISLVNN